MAQQLRLDQICLLGGKQVTLIGFRGERKSLIIDDKGVEREVDTAALTPVFDLDTRRRGDASV